MVVSATQFFGSKLFSRAERRRKKAISSGTMPRSSPCSVHASMETCNSTCHMREISGEGIRLTTPLSMSRFPVATMNQPSGNR